jgi:hypothetical protein
MNGNFSRVNLQGGGSKIKVEGWLAWDDAETKAKATATLNIAVTQGTVTAVGSGNVEYDDKTWAIDIPLNGSSFSKGTASGTAGAVVTPGSSTSWVSGPIPVN